jgi:hypothetical protein
MQEHNYLLDLYTVVCYTAGNAVHAWELVYDLSALCSSYQRYEPICSQLTASHQCYYMVCYTSEQSAFLYDTCVKYGSAGNCRRKFRNQTVPSRQTIHNLVNKLRTMELLTDKKQ